MDLVQGSTHTSIIVAAAGALRGALQLVSGVVMLKFPRWIHGWVSLSVGGLESIVFGSIRWCGWSFRPSSSLRLAHLKSLFVYVCASSTCYKLV